MPIEAFLLVGDAGFDDGSGAESARDGFEFTVVFTIEDGLSGGLVFGFEKIGVDARAFAGPVEGTVAEAGAGGEKPAGAARDSEHGADGVVQDVGHVRGFAGNGEADQGETADRGGAGGQGDDGGVDIGDGFPGFARVGRAAPYAGGFSLGEKGRWSSAAARPTAPYRSR